MKEECTGTAALLHKQREVAVEREVELNQLSKHLMLGKEREATLLEDKATLEIRQKHRFMESRGLYEAHVAKMREKERELKYVTHTVACLFKFYMIIVCIGH